MHTTFKMTSTDFHKLCQSRLDYLCSIWDNGDQTPNILRTRSFIIANRFPNNLDEVKKRQPTFTNKELVLDFELHIKVLMNFIENAAEEKWTNNEIFVATQLFQRVSIDLNKIVEISSDEDLTQLSKQIFDKATEYFIRDVENKEFEQHPDQRFIQEFRKHYSTARDVTGKFISENSCLNTSNAIC